MNTKTLKALKQSIAHWKRLATGKREDYEDIGIHDCALCQIFFEDGCDGCPVMKKTGEQSCKRTPYTEAAEAEDEFSLDSTEFHAEAKRMLEFLKSLLPRKRKL